MLPKNRDGLIYTFSRRSFLKAASAALVAGSSIVDSPGVAHAIEPTTVVAMLHLATTLMDAFGPKGPSGLELQQLETALLKEATLKLDILHAELSIVLSDTAQIKNLLLDVPHETVKELYRTKLGGATRHLGEIQNAYVDALPHGVTAARQSLLEEAKNLLNFVRETRSALMEYSDDLIILILALAMNVEVRLMIFADDTSYRKREALRSYQEWFNRFSLGGDRNLGLRMSKEASNFHALAEGLEKKAKANEKCRHVSMNISLPKPGFAGVKFDDHRETFVVSPDNDQKQFYIKGATDLRNKSGDQDIAVFDFADYSVANKKEDQHYTTNLSPVAKQFFNEIEQRKKDGQVDSYRCEKRRNSISSMVDDFNTTRSELYLSWQRYLALASLKAVCASSHTRIQNFQMSLP
jgi:hypothetical protein